MKEIVIAKRYGRAFFELAIEQGDIDLLARNLSLLRDAARMIPQMLRALSDERVDLRRRVRAARMIAQSLGLGAMATSAVCLLVEKGRILILDAIADNFLRRLEHHRKLAHSEATAAKKQPTEEIRRTIEEILSRALGMQAICNIGVDPELLGGFTLKMGDVRYDASIKGRLQRMREELL